LAVLFFVFSVVNLQLSGMVASEFWALSGIRKITLLILYIFCRTRLTNYLYFRLLFFFKQQAAY
jgi:hypothetical protein